MHIGNEQFVARNFDIDNELNNAKRNKVKKEQLEICLKANLLANVGQSTYKVSIEQIVLSLYKNNIR